AVALEHLADAAGQARDDAVLPRLHLLHVHRDAVDLDAHGVGVLQVLHQRARADHRLAGDAAPVEAHAADDLALHAHRLQPELRGRDGRDVAAGPGADDGDVGLHAVGGHWAGLRETAESSVRRGDPPTAR